jgi:hypothetical protein
LDAVSREFGAFANFYFLAGVLYYDDDAVKIGRILSHLPGLLEENS